MQNTARRSFLAAGAATAAAGLTVADDKPAANSSGGEIIKVGLIGCGGRGTGAAENALNADPRVRIVGFGDVFEDRAKGSFGNLRGSKKFGNRVTATPETVFHGFDAVHKVLALKPDYVILATPPRFRAEHFAAAVKANVHVFMEKPVAVDAFGIRAVIAAGEDAAKQGLSVVAGTQRRHQKSYTEVYERVRDGELGKILGGRCYWNDKQLWFKERQTGWYDYEWMIRDWVNWSWLSGDHIVEQHVHNLDVINWFLSKDGGSAHPVRAVGMGGRARRVTGDQFDFFSIDFEYDGGVHVSSYCRQINDCDSNVSEALVGEKGNWRSGQGLNVANIKRRKATDRKPAIDPYVQEHIDLIDSITHGKKLNEARNVAISTMTAIMGRMAAYTGKPVTWDEAIKSEVRLGPAEYTAETKCPPAKPPVPGRA